MREKLRPASFLLVWIAAVAAGAALFLLCYRFDNKYTRPRPASNMGVTRVEASWFREHPLFFLVDGWSFYSQKFLSPEEVVEHTPDAYLYIGRYGGYDLGDPEASPHGSGTYRTVLLTDGVPREYALELAQVYSRWRLWVNGELMQSVGMGDPDPPAPDGRMVTFTASDRIEIVVATEDDSHFYSGLVYPPAFGTPEAVSRSASLRFLIHGGACSVALVIALLCLVVGTRNRFTHPYLSLTLLCLCFCGSTAWPVFQVLGMRGDWWMIAERFCYYGIFLALMQIQARICKLPRRMWVPAFAAGGLVCISILAQPLAPVSTAGPLFVYAGLLALYRWLTAAWLLGTGVWARRRELPYSRTLLVGNSIFACALVMGELLPLFEPVLMGWFVEMAGAVFLFLSGGIVWHDTVTIYRESADLRARQQLAEIRLAADAEQARLSREYVRRTREQLHESRSRLTLIRHYLSLGQLEKLSAYLDELIPAIGGPGPNEFTGHPLTDAILQIQMNRAAQMDIYVEQDFCRLPEDLPISDDDLTSLLMNLLDNAIESCQRLPQEEPRWIWLKVARDGGGMEFACKNAAQPPGSSGQSTSKADKRAHGFGLPLLREIAVRYGGKMEITRTEDSFEILVNLQPFRHEIN